MTDWLMVIITAIYVIATIVICVANLKSAKATREQVEESKRQFEEQKRQFEETNRPYIACEYILTSRVFCGIRFYNYGSKPANNVTFKINDSFHDSVSMPNFWRLNDAEYAFGINQSYEFYFSKISDFKENTRDFEVEITYHWQRKMYTENIRINFTKQLPIESVAGNEEKLLDEIKNISSTLKNIATKDNE